MVNDHYPYEKWLFHWEYTLFSDKPNCLLAKPHTSVGQIPVLARRLGRRPKGDRRLEPPGPGRGG